MPDELPDYDRPPINEVVFGLQFQPVHSLKVQQLIEYWSRIRQRYPKIEEQLPLLHQKEQAIEPDMDGPSVTQFKNALPAPRYWFIDQPGNELIQIQKDKFLRNWRQLTGDEPYPRFERLSGAFWQEWQTFRTFIKDSNLGDLQIDQCELSYINHIEPKGSADKWDFAELPNVFAFLREKSRSGFLPEPEVLSFQSRYALPKGTGRFHVEMAPAFRSSDFKMIIQLTLSARGMTTSHSENDIKAWFEVAHEWIVRGFDELTTPKMHALWEKKI